MRRPSDTPRDDGFSLVELMTILVVGFIVLGLSYLIFESSMRLFRNVEGTTVQNRSAASSVARMTKPMREMQRMSRGRDYEVEFLADKNDDGVLERVSYSMAASSTDLVETTAHPNTGEATTTYTVADNVRNRMLSEPLFEYFDSYNVSIAGPDAARLTRTTHIELHVITQQRTTPLLAPVVVDTMVFLRNPLSS